MIPQVELPNARGFAHRRPLAALAIAALAAFAISLGAGCTSLTPAPTPETKYFVLDLPPKGKLPPQSLDKILVAPVRLPEYLNQQQLVVREKDHQIRIAKYHSWAEPLEVSIRRSISSQLNHKDLGYSFVPSCRGCPQLLVDIHHFYPTVDGEVLLTGGYRFEGLARSGANQFKPFHFAGTLSSDGYASAVTEMRGLLGELTDSVAATIRNTK